MVSRPLFGTEQNAQLTESLQVAMHLVLGPDAFQFGYIQ